MGLDDYAAVGGGALKLKGAKVAKKKKTRSKTATATDLEKNLSSGATKENERDTEKGKKKAMEKRDDPVRLSDNEARAAEDEDEDEEEPDFEKTESERRHEEARKKRLLQLTQAGASRPELLKTHKERVEKLNTYLSRLSEHHDMPKIGPG